MHKYQIFVSGMQKELKKERLAIKELVNSNIILKEYFDIFLFEQSSAKSKSSKDTYLDAVRRSDIYIGLFGDEYGNVPNNNISATETEFREAQRKEKEILVYIKGQKDKSRNNRLKKLITEIKNEDIGYKYKRFDDIQGLKNAVHESLIDFLREKGIVGKTLFENNICASADFSDIDINKAKWFLRTARKKRNFPLPEDTPVEDIFIHLNLLNDNKLTNAAILLFGKDPHRFHLQAEVKCLQFQGTEVEKPFLSYHIYSGNLFEQIDRAAAFVLSSIRLPVIQQKHTAQVKRPPEIPLFSVQEAIVNAVAHRNYNSNAGVQVMVFVDRVEVWNPGSLPSHLAIADLKRPHHSCPGNPLIAEVLYLTNYIQKAGSGTIEMIKQCKAQGLPEPEFVNNRGYEFRTILGRDIFTENILIKFGLNERQLKAVKYVKKQYKITNKDYKELTGVSKPTATRDLNDLVRKKVFDKYGITGKGTIYKLKGS